jgi:2-polyprenyl-3-methyl-5-hydroxy-6-metoxy-1,4-benzoquinol methylase
LSLDTNTDIYKQIQNTLCMKASNVVSQQSADGYGYRDLKSHPALKAAQVVVELLRGKFNFNSVLDVGCGVGLWLKAYESQGISDIMGLDGVWVPQENIVVTKDKFKTHDLTTPFSLGRKFDLVMCLEVAEHLPEVSADILLDSLVAHGDLIMFSAAIPGQGGFCHVNEQYQEYWIARFKNRGFTAYDAIRPLIWNHPSVPYYYGQNTLIFSIKPLNSPLEFVANIIHPELYARKCDPRNYSIRKIVNSLPFYLSRLLRFMK